MNLENSVIVYPTDTVWGIGANIFSRQLQSDIATIKGTDPNKPLSVLFGNMDMLKKYVTLPEVKEFQWQDFFKLETTVLIPKNLFKDLPSWITFDSDLVGVRVVENAATKELFSQISCPITTTSLNLTGQDPIVANEQARNFYQKHCPHAGFVEHSDVHPSGQASTIVALAGDEVRFVREGALVSDVRKLLGL